nr:MAG TPA: hypothetical protein [Caudoviricetes sp.]
MYLSRFSDIIILSKRIISTQRNISLKSFFHLV